MFDFSQLALAPECSRAARNYFGWPQSKAAEESGLPLHKIKRFEAGNYIPDAEFLEDLRAFYEKRGYLFDDTPAPGDSAKRSGQVFPGGVVGDEEDTASDTVDYRGRTGTSNVHHMRIALQDDAEMGRVLDLIENNEERVTALLRNPIKPGLFSDVSEASGAQHAEAIRMLAENGMLFARLFGRHMGGKPTADTLQASRNKPAITADLLHSLQADAHLTASGDADAAERHKFRKPASSVAEALGLS